MLLSLNDFHFLPKILQIPKNREKIYEQKFRAFFYSGISATYLALKRFSEKYLFRKPNNDSSEFFAEVYLDFQSSFTTFFFWPQHKEKRVLVSKLPSRTKKRFGPIF